jgi:hypothetical protein
MMPREQSERCGSGHVYAVVGFRMMSRKDGRTWRACKECQKRYRRTHNEKYHPRLEQIIIASITPAAEVSAECMEAKTTRLRVLELRARYGSEWWSNPEYRKQRDAA